MITERPLHIGFTGTQHGMTDVQAERVAALVQHRDFYAHHGCCVGADEQFDMIVRLAKNFRGVVHHPCDPPDKQMTIRPDLLRDAVRPIRKPLVRNMDIVIESHVMIGAPREMRPQRRSGTWTTIGYAREAKKPMWIVFPNGSMISDGDGW